MTSVLADLGALSTSALSDALDRLGIVGQLPGIFPVAPTMQLVGRAFTVQYENVSDAGGTVGDFVDDVPTDAVVVLDNHGRTDATVWGDLMTAVAHRRRLPGTVINGVCRDTRLIRELNHPIFSCGRWMRTGKDRVQMVAVGTVLTIGGVRIAPEDFLVGDGDGVLAIPAARLFEVLDTAHAIEAAETRIRNGIAAGGRLDELRSTVAYHSLQTRRGAE